MPMSVPLVLLTIAALRRPAAAARCWLRGHITAGMFLLVARLIFRGLVHALDLAPAGKSFLRCELGIGGDPVALGDQGFDMCVDFVFGPGDALRAELHRPPDHALRHLF